jgi:hypothetical protein
MLRMLARLFISALTFSTTASFLAIQITMKYE